MVDEYILHSPIGAPVSLSKEALSVLTGSISIACWAMVFSPQLYDIFRRQNADNLSLSFLALWFTGDVANIIGCILQEVLPTMTILAVYNTLADLVLIFQVAYYRRRRTQLLARFSPIETDIDNDSASKGEEMDSGEYEYFQSMMIPPRRIWKSVFFKFGIILMIVMSSIIGLYCATNGHLYDTPAKYYNPYIPINVYGQMCGWFCASIYVISRIPQIVLNYKQRLCERTSLLNFMFASLGNFFFIISIVSLDNSSHYLKVNSSWLTGTACSLTLDYLIVFQSWYYNCTSDSNKSDGTINDEIDDGKKMK
ncbi:PQ loop repeat-domain-containing protein [Dipodascopsis uninucleata]